MIFDIENIGDDFGKYQPEDGVITVYLANIYDDFKRKHGIIENYLIYKILDTIIHEDIHKVIDDCLEGKPDEIDDHKIYMFLREL